MDRPGPEAREELTSLAEGTDPLHTDAMAASVADVRGRTLRGVAAVTLRGVGVRTVGLIVSIVLARLLVPADFGLLAFGTTLLVVGTFLTKGGLAAQLIRSPEPPTRRQLSAILGLQLGVTLLLVVVATLVLLPRGREAQVTALMLWGLIPATYRVPAAVQLERELRFRSVAVAEVLETCVYAVVAIGTVVLGAGVWGVAAATVIRPLAGTIALQRAAPVRVVRPTVDWRTVAPLLSFGVTFQLTYVVGLLRDQGVNLVTIGVGGTVALGYWSLAQRVMLVPFLIFESVWRVSYPAISRLLEAGHDVRDDLARGLVLGSFLTGLLLVPLAVAAPAVVPATFGDTWEPMVPIIWLSAAGLMISGPLAAIGSGFLSATGRIRIVMTASAVSIVPWLGLVAILLPRMGPEANGIGWLAAALAEASVVGWALQKHGGLRVVRSIAPLATAALLPGAAGLYLVLSEDLRVLPALAVAAVSTLIYIGIGTLVARDALKDLRRIGAFVRRAAPQPDASRAS